LQNISGTNGATWQQKLAADIPSLQIIQMGKLKVSFDKSWGKQNK
jgi:hypothetical protein